MAEIPLPINTNPLFVFETGLSFESVAIKHYDMTYEKIFNSHSTVSSTLSIGEFSVAIVNLAFALELYLKCLLLIDTGSSPRTHNLFNLYKQLLAARQQKIESYFKQEFLAAWVQTDPTRKVPRLDDVLNEAAAAFVDWRYFFEKQDAINWNCDYVPAAVRLAILDVKPEWICNTYKHQVKSTFHPRYNAEAKEKACQLGQA